MASGLNTQLILALAIVAVAAILFGWRLVSTTRRVGLLVSESKVPLRYMVLGFVAALGLMYYARR